MTNSAGGTKDSGYSPQSKDVLRDFAPLPYLSLDPEGSITTVNEAWLDLLGYESEQVKGESLQSFLTSESAHKFDPRFSEFKATGGVSDIEFTMIESGGEEIQVSFDGRIEYSEEGSVQNVHCQFRDISELKEYESHLKKNPKHVQKIHSWDQ